MRRRGAVWMLGLIGLLLPVQPLSAQVEAYRLICDPDSLAYLYANAQTNRTISASLEHDGRRYDNLRLRIRGDGSRERPKKSLKLIADAAVLPGTRRALNFNADYLDRSYMHTVLSTHLIRASGQATFAAEHVVLYLNDDFLGLYVEVENMDEAFLVKRGMDPDGNLYKAARDDASMSVFDNVFYHWEKKTNEGGDWDDLRALIHAMNTVPDSAYLPFVQQTYSYEQMVNMIAINMMIANGSTYYHNYYLYHDIGRTGRWEMLPWDLDYTLGSYNYNYPYPRSSSRNSPDNPYLERALLTPQIFADVRERVDVLAETIVNTAYVNPLIDSLRAVLEPAVLADTTDDVPDLAAWEAEIEKEKTYFRRRHDALRAQFEAYPELFRVHREVERNGQALTLRWDASSDPQGGPVTYTVRFGTHLRFWDDYTTVYEGITDTVFTLPVTPEPGLYYWNVSVRTDRFQVEGFDSRNVVYVPATEPLPLVVNEVNYNAFAGMDTEDWVELYNPHEAPVDLIGWRLHDAADYHTYTFPPGARIEPRGFAILSRDTAAFRAVHPDVAPVYGNFDFGLSSDGDAVRLVDVWGDSVEAFAYANAAPWPTAPDGAGPTLERRYPALPAGDPAGWQASLVTGGTPGAVNSVLVTGTGELQPEEAWLGPVYPNPVRSSARLAYGLDRPGHVVLRVYDALGRVVRVLVDAYVEAAGRRVLAWNGDGLSPGWYVVELRVDGRRVEARQVVVAR